MQGGGANQFAGDGNTTFLTWTSNTTAHPRHYDALFRPLAGGASVNMNAAGTVGFSGDINGDTTEAVYQQVDSSGSDLYTYDLATQTPTAAPDAVNSTLWEYGASISDGYILYGRNKFTRRSSPWKIMLYDRNTDTNIVLDTVTHACACVYPGQVSDDYATWTRCTKSICQAWYYDIAGETTSKIPNPNDKLQYFPAVSAATGDLYFVQSAFGCGLHTKIMQWNPVDGGAANVVSAQPRGYDVYLGPNVFDDWHPPGRLRGPAGLQRQVLRRHLRDQRRRHRVQPRGRPPLGRDDRAEAVAGAGRHAQRLRLRFHGSSRAGASAPALSRCGRRSRP